MTANSKQILKKLAEEYAGTTTALIYHNPYELLVATILSAQSTDLQVNKITAPLFAKYPTPIAISKLSESELAAEIKGVGLYRTKAKHILAATKILLEKYGGGLPQEREALLALPGVGRKTANVVLANAFNLPALGVDTHVLRVAHRLGLAQAKNPRGVEEELTKIIPQNKWAEAHHWLIWHGRKVCGARKPNCSSCIVSELCPSKLGTKGGTLS